MTQQTDAITKEVARIAAADATLETLQRVVGTAGYDLRAAEDVHRFSQDLRWLAETRKLDEERGKTLIAFAAAILTAGFGAVATVVIQWFLEMAHLPR